MNDAADGARRGVPLSLSQAQARQPRLRLHSGAAGVAIGSLGQSEFPAQPMNLGLLVIRTACRLALDVAHATLHRAASLLDRFRPRTADLQDLGPVDEAVPGKHAELVMSVAPIGESRSPLADAVERVDPVAARDSGAIDDARHDRRELAGGGGHHRLVHQRKAAIEQALAEQRAALQIARESYEVRFTETFA